MLKFHFVVILRYNLRKIVLIMKYMERVLISEELDCGNNYHVRHSTQEEIIIILICFIFLSVHTFYYCCFYFPWFMKNMN